MNILDFREQLNSAMKEQYESLTNKSFNDYLDKHAVEINNKLKLILDSKNLNQQYIDAVQKIKIRWVESEIEKSSSELNKLISAANSVYDGLIKLKSVSNDNSINIEEQFKSIYSGCKDPKEYREMLEEELYKWRDDFQSSFFSYKYIKHRNIKSINAATRNDIIKLAEKLIRSSDITTEVMVPSSWDKIQEEPTGKVVMEKNYKGERVQVLYSAENTTESITFEVNEDAFIEYVKADKVDKAIKEEVEKQLNVFSSFDRRVLTYILNQKELYTQDGKMHRSIADIAKSVCGKNTKPYKEKIKHSLWLLASCVYKHTGAFSGGGFFSLRYETVPLGEKGLITREYVHILINPIYKDYILKNQVIRFYANIYNNLSDIAQRLLISFQTERISMVFSENTNTVTCKTIADFERMILFKSTRGTKNKIISALNELVDNRIAVKSYKLINKYEFEITYYPFTQEAVGSITSNQKYIEAGDNNLVR